MSLRTHYSSRMLLVLLVLLVIGGLVVWVPTGSAEEHEGRSRAKDKRQGDGGRRRPPATRSYVVLGYNDLGMHCMNQDFSQLCILPPYNNLHAQVIERGREEPRIIGSASSGVTVRYTIPGNTTSANKTNFWNHARALLG